MILDVRNISYGYSTDCRVFDDVSFTVETGEICCIIGANGVGKTTLFKSILKLLKIQKGEIRIDGENIGKWSTRRMAKTIAYVSQLHVPPFPYKIKDVVMLGRVSSTGYFKQPSVLDYDIAEKAMKDMGVWEMRDQIYTDISGGERQLVMIARALAQEPQILVMDEPTANLDYGNQVKVMREIRALKEKGYAIVMTTHSPDQAFACDSNVVLLQRDSPVIFGPASHVITEKNLQEAYGVQVKIMQYHDSKGNVRRICAPTLD